MKRERAHLLAALRQSTPRIYGFQTAKQLQQMSQDPQKLADALKQAGMDPAMAQNPAAMKQAIGSLNPTLTGFDASCFDGVYVTGDITAEDIARLNQGRDQTEEGEEDSSRLTLPNAQTA